jgi:hypothetical protein
MLVSLVIYTYIRVSNTRSTNTCKKYRYIRTILSVAYVCLCLCACACACACDVSVSVSVCGFPPPPPPLPFLSVESRITV